MDLPLTQNPAPPSSTALRDRRGIRFTPVFLLTILALALLIAAPLCAQEKPAPPRAKGPTAPMRVLFIGNSYTSFNNLPGMVQALATAGRQKRPFEFVTIAPGGWTLQRHMDDEKSEAPGKIAEGNWDYVVLQDQSQTPFIFPDATINYGKALGALAKEQDARPLLFVTWSRQKQADKQEAINATYAKLAEQLDAKMAPVGSAWIVVGKEKPALQLYNKDGSHPTPAGSYLAACVFYSVIYDKSPQGLPGRLVRKEANKLIQLCDLLKPDAALLQKAAWETVSAKAPASADEKK